MDTDIRLLGSCSSLHPPSVLTVLQPQQETKKFGTQTRWLKEHRCQTIPPTLIRVHSQSAFLLSSCHVD